MMPYSKQKARAESMLSCDLRRQIALLTTAELLELMNKQIEETQDMINLLTEEIQLRLMEKEREE